MIKSIYSIIITLLVLTLVNLTAEAKTDSDKKFTIVVDAGHGGKDIGATDNGVREKDINLKVAKNLESLIKKKMKDAKVVLTRDDDTYLTLQQRADKANKAQGDIFISIHTNSVDKKNRNRKNIAGSSVYTLGLHKDENNLEVARRENAVIELEQNFEQKYSGFDPQRDESYIIFEMAQKKNLSQSIQLADHIQKELVNSGRSDRGVHQAGFWVLWATSMPSVLVELDFICNPNSAKYLSSEKGSKELAEAIFKALQTYEKNWRRNSGSLALDYLSDEFSTGDTSNLEDTYAVINSGDLTKVKARNHKKESNAPMKDVRRRRRSNASKEISLQRDYEQSNLTYPSSTQYATMESVKEETPELASVTDTSKDNKAKSKAKKKEEKKKQKEAKKKEEQESKKRKADAHNAKINKLVTVFKIQILASSDLLSQENKRFEGLSPITTFKENNLYKYYYGESTNRSEIEELLATVRDKFPDAFIVSSKKTVPTSK